MHFVAERPEPRNGLFAEGQSLLQSLPADRDAPILSVCQRGNASLSGLLFLKSLGYRNVRSITGGTLAWREKGFATDSGA